MKCSRILLFNDFLFLAWSSHLPVQTYNLHQLDLVQATLQAFSLAYIFFKVIGKHNLEPELTKKALSFLIPLLEVSK